MSEYLIGVDVGTLSARAGIFDIKGKTAGYAIVDISLNEPQSDYAEQSTSDIWRALCSAIKSAMNAAGISKEQIKGIGFTATCSLVLQDSRHIPLYLDKEGKQDVILWLDHRSVAEANEITQTKDKALDTIGKTMSPEMQLPKLLWLKRNRPDIWSKLGFAFDLSDWLTWKASGDTNRSLCTTVCKWAFDAKDNSKGVFGSWSQSFFKKIDLTDLLENNATIIGQKIVLPGTPMGEGLTNEAAEDFGLLPGTPVAAGLIDAHAGAAGILLSGNRKNATGRMALIAGTSNCHMLLSDKYLEVPGIWGPYKNVILPDLWLAEGGQSASGIFLQRLIEFHPAHKQLPKNWEKRFMILDKEAIKKIKQIGLEKAVGEWRIVPDFAGNRSPLARPELRGVLMGASLNQSFDDLIGLYIAGLLALAHGTKHIIDNLTSAGHKITGIVVTGSGATNALSMQLHADLLGLEVVSASETDGVSLGAAMTGATASSIYKDLKQAMGAMSRAGKSFAPDMSLKLWHQRRYEAFLKLQATSNEIMR